MHIIILSHQMGWFSGKGFHLHKKLNLNNDTCQHGIGEINKIINNINTDILKTF
jgi:hypothetical protein